MNRVLRCATGLLAAFAVAGASHAASFYLFESGQVRPLALTPDGSRLLAVNTPDNRLEIFDVEADGLVHVASVPVGLEPVAVAARNDNEAWVVNFLSDSVSVIDLSANPPRVTRTLLVGDEPRDLVFAGTGGNRAFITTAHRGQHSPDPRGEYNVAGAGRADVWVFDANKLGASLEGNPVTIVELFGDKPRALAVNGDGSRVFAAVFHSGNKTTTVSEGVVCDTAGPCSIDQGTAPGGLPAPVANFDDVTGPQVGLIVKHDVINNEWRDELDRDWSDGVRFDLPDYDVFEIDANAATPVELTRFASVGTILFNMLYDANRDALWVSNTDANNRVRFEGEGVVAGAVKPAGEPASVRGKLAQSRVTLIDRATSSVTPRHLNKHIAYDIHPAPAGVKEASLATPLGMALSANGETLYVAGFGSQAIGVYDADAIADDSFDPLGVTQIALGGGGPTGLVLDEARGRLYVATRFDNAIGMIDLGTQTEIARYGLPNPEPQSVIDGRPFLYDAKLTSSNGEASCSSCHIFGDMDDLAWDLGDPDGGIETNANPFTVGSGNPFHPMKGPMTTQSLRGMANHGPMHWRGDRSGASSDGDALDEDAAFKAFNGAFVGLIGRENELTTQQMQAFTDFALQISYPPNPIRQLDNGLRADEARGLTAYFQEPGPDIVESCNGCHILDPSAGFFGGNGNSSVEGESQEFKIPHLRNAYQKVGMFGMPNVAFNVPTDNSHMGDQIRGFGYLHDGSTDTLFRFFHATVFNIGFNLFFPDPNQTRLDLEALMMAFDTTFAPIVGQQVTLTGTNAAVADPRIDLMLDRADVSFELVDVPGATEADIVVSGIVGGAARSWFRQANGDFQDDTGAVIGVAALRALASAEQPLTFTAVPPGSGLRIAIDRDEDGVLNGLDTCPAVADTGQADADADGVGDACDNCIAVANAAQSDANGDGYGTLCDADLDNDGFVGFSDLAVFASLFGTADPVADLNNSGGIVNFADLALFAEMFGAAPGPSALD